jgi:hypothetical protein
MTRFYKFLAALGLTAVLTMAMSGCSWETDPEEDEHYEEEYEEIPGDEEVDE